MPGWLSDAVFYEVYPQSFCDTNGDGIGDIPGIISKLDYIRGLGCNALWINPCFASPFRDGGYDVADYETVAPRYGTNDDLYNLFASAHKLGMHVLLDLVPGHTSDHSTLGFSRVPCHQQTRTLTATSGQTVSGDCLATCVSSAATSFGTATIS